ncbi:hypothetical protein [Fimbriiglobus ruber]|uniref:Uncharacterized protein n=1 Tax=Fimbriiglobus ruber TaxID=1908690 RepID=A0A225E6P9_9BACT|nr:hypothetical protein [Fimbriiglobus ruber]OWK45786.1 hypothetical protein FRUB_02117 [Fimbriiglobus ruber]
MGNDDPTMTLIRQLDDPSKWAVKRRVSVFKPHTRTFPTQALADGQTLPARTVTVTAADLSAIAANVNRAYRRDGSLVKLTVGHRQFDPRFPEPSQPPLVGYARNYRAELVDRPGGKVLRLTHDEYVPVGKTGVWDQYPERSPDYDPAARTITGVALLVRDPALDLGTVGYHAGTVTYAMGAVMADDTDDTDDTGADDADDADLSPDEEAQYARVCRYVRKYGHCARYMDDDEGNDDQTDAQPTPQDRADEKKITAYMRRKYARVRQYLDQAAGGIGGTGAAGRAMGPTNGGTPAPDDTRYNVPYQKGVLDRIARLEAERDAERDARVRVECARMLDGVRAVVRFGYQKELAALTTFPTTAARNDHVAYMLDTYEKLPGDARGGFLTTPVALDRDADLGGTR